MILGDDGDDIMNFETFFFFGGSYNGCSALGDPLNCGIVNTQKQRRYLICSLCQLNEKISRNNTYH